MGGRCVSIALAVLLGLTGCQSDGPVEPLGEGDRREPRVFASAGGGGEICRVVWDDDEWACEIEGIDVPAPGCHTLQSYEPGVGCYCENGSDESDCFILPGFPGHEPPYVPPGEPGGGGGSPPDPPSDPMDWLDFELDCDGGTQVRGSMWECEMVADSFPEGAGVYWSFVPDDVEIAPGISVPTLPIVPFDEQSSIWRGPVVTSGWVVLEAYMEGAIEPRYDSVRIEVTDRSWDPAIDAQEVGYSLGSVGEGPLGENMQRAGGTESLDPYSSIGETQFVEIQGGPNKGYMWVPDHGVQLYRDWGVHDDLKASSTNLVTVGATSMNRYGWADQQNLGPETTLEGLRAHESYGQGGALGHQRALELSAVGGSCGNLAGLLERAVAPDPGVASVLFSDVLRLARETLAFLSDHHRVHGNFGPRQIVAGPGSAPGTISVFSVTDTLARVSLAATLEPGCPDITSAWNRQ